MELERGEDGLRHRSVPEDVNKARKCFRYILGIASTKQHPMSMSDIGT